MAFALSLVKLETAMKERGCPICRMGRTAAARSVDSFLWENVNDPDLEKPISDAYGFCPQHTRLLVSTEMRTAGPVLGVNLIYGRLLKKTVADLRALPLNGKSAGSVQRWLKRNGVPGSSGRSVLPQQGVCPACAFVEQSNRNALFTFFEALEKDDEDLWTLYLASDGFCLPHLRTGLEQFAGEYPSAARRLADDAAGRLERARAAMAEYVRKNNWEYRDEPITEEEQIAWQKALTFFTGLSGDRFNLMGGDE